MRWFRSFVLTQLLFLPVSTGMAQVRETAKTLTLESQPLSSAVNAFAMQTEAVIIAPSYILHGKNVSDINQITGDTEYLLGILLSGTELGFKQTSENIFVIYSLEQDREGETDKYKEDFTNSTASPPERFYQPPQIVTGSYIDSLTRALDRKKAADNIIDTIDATNVIDFPAQNIAEALQRVTGISVSYDRGEALFVNVRGLGPAFQTVALNGTPIAVNENVRDSGQDGRQFRFDIIPAELIAGVDVFKTPDATREEGAIGAIINVRTFRPLDLNTGTRVANFKTSFSELSDKVDPFVSLLSSWKSQDAKIGVLGALSFNKRTLRQDRIKLVDWDNQQELTDAGSAFLFPENIIIPVAVRPTLEEEVRDRWGVNGIVQYRPNDNFYIEAETFYLLLDSTYEELTYSASWDASTLKGEDYTIENDAVLNGIVTGESQIGIETSRLLHDNLVLSLRTEFSLGEDEISALASFSHAMSKTEDPIMRTRVESKNVGKIQFSFPQSAGQGLPDITFLDADLTSPDTLPFRRIEYRDQNSLDTDLIFKVNYKKPSASGQFDFGLSWRRRTRIYDRQDLIYQSRGGEFFPDSFYTLRTVEDFLGGEGATLPQQWLVPIPKAFAVVENFDGQFGDPTENDLHNSYKISEEIGSAYVLKDFDAYVSDFFVRGNLGLRASQTFQTSSGHALDDDHAIPVEYKKDYFDLLPSANVLVELKSGMRLRAALAKVITRPSLADLAPRLTLNSGGDLEAIGGNPQLERFQAWQADLALGYEPSENTYLNANLFSKRFDTFVYDQVQDFMIGTETYSLTAPFNGGKAIVYGAEFAAQHKFAYLPAPYNGLGFQANVSWTRSEASYSEVLEDDLEGVAERSYSVGAFYDYNALQARLVYNYRGEVLSAVGINSDLSVNEDAFGSLDGSLSYSFTPNIKFAIEGRNLLDDAQWQFVRDHQFGGYTKYGRSLLLSLRITNGSFTKSKKKPW